MSKLVMENKHTKTYQGIGLTNNKLKKVNHLEFGMVSKLFLYQGTSMFIQTKGPTTIVSQEQK